MFKSGDRIIILASSVFVPIMIFLVSAKMLGDITAAIMSLVITISLFFALFLLKEDKAVPEVDDEISFDEKIHQLKGIGILDNTEINRIRDMYNRKSFVKHELETYYKLKETLDELKENSFITEEVYQKKTIYLDEIFMGNHE